MNNRYQLVVFDWEGTISDTLGPVLHTISSVASEYGFGAFDFQEARKCVDLGLVQALKKIVPQVSDTEHERLLHLVQEALRMRSNEPCLMPGVLDVIRSLAARKVDLAIATNKGYHSLQRALQVTGLDQYFLVTRSAGQVPAKPCPQMLEELMQAFGRTPQETVMIGDSPTDMEMAHCIGVMAIGVDFYHQQESALRASGAVAVVDNYQLLEDLLINKGE